MAIKPIERISMPDPQTFYREYVFRRRPVIIRDLFQGEGIREIKSLQDARAAFDDVKIVAQREYSSSEGSSGSCTMTFGAYWDMIAADPSTTMVCTEYEIPARIMERFSLPAICTYQPQREEEILGLPRKYGDHDLFANVFFAGRGNKAHLHYDGDHRHVLLYQVCGRKRVILVQPQDGFNLKPLDGPFYCGAGVFLDHMADHEKDEFLDMADAYCATLEPGEAVYMPMLIWHHLEYVDDGMSFNVRFGRNACGRFMSVDNLHRDYFVQNLGTLFVGHDGAMSSERKETMDRIVAEYVKPVSDIHEKVRDMRAVLREACARLLPECRPDEASPVDREDEQIQKIVKDLQHTLRYAPPDVVRSSRPAGPASASQKQQIERKAARYGYSDALLKRILLNRVGKQDIADLTKVEAAAALNYMMSPGATL